MRGGVRVLPTLIDSKSDPYSLFCRASVGKTGHSFPGSALGATGGERLEGGGYSSQSVSGALLRHGLDCEF
jgi:hypothetical protein